MPAAVPLILGAAAYTGVSAAIGGALFTAIAGSTIGAVAATAIGTGVLSAGISLAQGADLGDSIKNGVLSGATSFIGGTIGSYISSGSEAVSAAISEDAAFVAADAAQMAKQGLSQNQIAYNLAASGVNAGTAQAASVAAILNGGENAGEIIDSILFSMPTGTAAASKSLFVDASTQAQYANLGIEPPVAGAKPTYNYGADKWTWEAPDGTLYNQAGQVLNDTTLAAISPPGFTANDLIELQPGQTYGGDPTTGYKTIIDSATGTSYNAYTGEVIQYGTGSAEYAAANPDLFQTTVPTTEAAAEAALASRGITADLVTQPPGTIITQNATGGYDYYNPATQELIDAQTGDIVQEAFKPYVPPTQVAPAPAPVVDPTAIPAWAPEGTVAVETANGPGFRMPGDNVVYDRTGSVIEVQQANVPVAEAPVSQPIAEAPVAPAPQPVTEAPVSQPVAEAPVAPAPVAPTPAPAPQSVPYRMADGSVVYQTPSGIYTAEGGLVHPNPDWVNWNELPTEAEFLASQQVAQAPVSTPVPENTIPVTLPDGSVGAYDPATNTVYDGSGNTVATTNPASNAGTDVASGPSGITSDAPYRVDVTGIAGSAEAPSYAIREYMTPGTDLATQAQIDSGQAQWNPAANAWEVNAPVQDLGEVVITAPRPEIVPTLPEVVVTAPSGVGGAIGEAVGAGLGGAITAPVAPPAPPVQQPVDRDPNPNAVITPGTGTDPVANVDITGPGPVAPEPVVTPPYTPPVTQPPLSPVEPVTLPPNPPIPEVVVPEPAPVIEPPAEIIPPETTPPGGNYSDVGGAIGAVIGAPGVTPPPATRRPYGPIPPTEWGTVGGLVNPGLNPGLINAQEFYNTTSPVQGQYYWGNHPYQPGPTFDPLLYNNVPGAAAQPWGLQQMYTPVDLNAVLARYGVAGPIAPPKY